MRTTGFFSLMLLALSVCACSSGGENGESIPTPEPIPPTPQQVRINISTTVEGSTRVTDNAFEKGDQAGLYVVNRRADGSAVNLAASGNHVDNMRFTYDGTWNPDAPTYWSDNKTHADFYLYYPFTSGLATVNAVPFNLVTDQSTESAYKSCDVLVGSASNIAPTDQAVVINARHVMSKVLIVLAAGNGFTDESLSKAEVGVKVNNVRLQSMVDIATGKATANGSAVSLTPLKTAEGYAALLPPQSVTDGNLITVTVDGRAFNLSKAFVFKSGVRHKFTVTLSKTSNGVNVNITKWEDDGIDNGGTAE